MTAVYKFIPSTMSLNPYTTPFFLKIEASSQKAFIIIVPHILSFILIAWIDVFSLWGKFVLAVLLLVSIIYYVRYHLVLNLKKSVLSIQQDSQDNWLITRYNSTQNNELIGVTLQLTSFISRYLMVLNFKDTKGAYYSVIILQDSISPINFKYLYVRLKTTYIK